MKKIVTPCIIFLSLSVLTQCSGVRNVTNNSNRTSTGRTGIISPPTKGLCIGNSTVAEYLGGSSVASLLFTAEEIVQGYNCQSLAVPGHTIDQQLELWKNFQGKEMINWIIVEIGLNDLAPDDPLETTLNRYQRLIDTINKTSFSNTRVILATMTPVRQRLKDVYRDAGKANTSYRKWLAMNNAIMGKDKYAIKGVDYRFNGHTIIMGDRKGNLRPEYELSQKDHVHQNTAGRMVMASQWRIALTRLGMLH